MTSTDLAHVAHTHQIHPDYLYRVTLDGKPHLDMTGWEPNPAMSDGYRGQPDADQYRPDWEPRERYWRLRVRAADEGVGEAARLERALHCARKHPAYEYRSAPAQPDGWEPNPAAPHEVRVTKDVTYRHYMRRRPTAAPTVVPGEDGTLFAIPGAAA